MEERRVRRTITRRGVLAMVLLLAGCSGGSPGDPAALTRPPALSADAVPHSTSEFAVLDLQRVTSGAPDASSLSALLERATFTGGTERTFVSRSTPLDRVSTRVLEFSGRDGATAYLRWVESHPADLIGEAKGGPPLDLRGAPQVYVHTPNGCCPKDVPKSLAVWQRDRYVLVVIANGGLAKQKPLLDLASQLDGII
jgi:hypothetical protein